MSLIKRSLSLAGHRTSISLEPDFWAELDRLARAEGRSLASLVGEIDAGREDEPLASSVRVWVLRQLRHTALQKD
ncbi:ribbon-helix-helix domain-containing protein [Maricaulis sp.]|uniref:ribbon-helix-helix domain-containing protein n=1 Tax=Maricaulis sp. TaxID=1486257 RepID=UPI00344D9AEE